MLHKRILFTYKKVKKMTKKFFIIAGEASGDLLGAKLISELKSQLSQINEQAEFFGVGGKLMKEQGLNSIFPMEELSIMGFLEVLPHIPKLLKRINQTAVEIKNFKPDFVITIDSPDFCFRVIKKVKDVKVKKIHLIAPSVWAYREGRAKKISKLYDLLLAILPFEPPYFEKYGLKTVFIGHPIVENAPEFSLKKSYNSSFREKYNIDKDDFLICITAGSRNGEVKKIFSEFIKAINLASELSSKKKQIKVVIPLIDKTRNLVTKMSNLLRIEYFLIEKDEKEQAFFASDFALAKSGTNTVEISLYKIPMIIAYKINIITYYIVNMMVKIKFANLINLIANREIIPEMLQFDCDGDKIFKKLEKFICNKEVCENQIVESQKFLEIMGLNSFSKSSYRAAKEILSLKYD